MTGFFMRDSTNSLKHWCDLLQKSPFLAVSGVGAIKQLSRWLIAGLMMVVQPALVGANDAESVRVDQPVLVSVPPNAWSIEAEVSVALSPPLIEAVKRGLPLYFVSEFELLRNRWYWFDEKLSGHVRVVRLMYHAVTQHYWVTVGSGHPQTYPQLEQALSAATQLQGWALPDAVASVLTAHSKELKSNPDRYELRLRVRLDTAQLPKPLQMNALTNRDWNLSSDWVLPKLTAGTAVRPPLGTGQSE
ncbi:MAG: hypothetical protein RL676_828 [Pseudomonadota bacterium]